MSTDNRPPALGWPRKTWYGALGIVLPLFCFAVAFVGHLEGSPLTTCRSGRIKECFYLMLGNGVVPFFYPFLVFSMVSLVYALSDDARAARSLWVRLGLATGLVLAMQYTITLVEFGIPSLVLIMCGGFVLAMRGRFGKLGALFMVVVVLLVWSVLVTRHWGGFFDRLRPEAGWDNLWFLFPLLLVAAPGIVFLTYLRISLYLNRIEPVLPDVSPTRRVVASAAWLGAYALVVFLAVERTMDAYRSLPLK
jgi:hypothetical protein